MWDYSSIEDNWKKRNGNIDKRIFNYLRQEIEDVRYYSKCLDGTSYVYAQDLNDIYDVSKYRDTNTYKIDSKYSTYFNGPKSNGVSISKGGNSEPGFYNRYKSEYGFTLKNLFSPKRLFDYTNYLNVDIASTEHIKINSIDPDKPLIIDNIRMVEGQRLLIKDNISTVTLDASINPDTYFVSNYYIESTVSNQITYKFYNKDNGIYLYTNGTLIRESDLDTYSTNIEYSIYVKMGETNITKHYHLSRLLNGTFPLSSNNDPIEFTEKVDYIVRNSLEYKNVLDNKFYSSFIQFEEFLDINDDIYRISDRMFIVGDFGMILNYQNGYVNIIENKFKEDLKDIIDYENNYFIVGDNGNLLTMDKINTELDIIPLDTFENFTAIDITSNGRGIIVGENGTIMTSLDTREWNSLESYSSTNLNDVLFSDIASANVVGNNGVYKTIKLNNNSEYYVIEKELKIKPNLFDERIIKDDLYNLNNIKITNQLFKFEGNDWVDINKDINSSFSFDFAFKPTDLSGTNDQVLFTFVPTDTTQPSINELKGIKVLIRLENSEYRLKVVITDNTGNSIYLDGDIILTENKWYHLFLTRYKNEYQLFINKRVSDYTDQGFPSNFNNFNNRIRLGAELSYNFTNSTYRNISDNYFKGVIHNVRLWDTNLNNREVFDYSNNYSEELPYLNSWYKFNIVKEDDKNRILTKDLINGKNLILPSFSNILKYNNDIPQPDSMIDIETFTGVSIIGDKLISFVLDNSDVSYSDMKINNNFFIQCEESTKNLLYNGIDKFYYGISDKRVFRIDSGNLEFNLFNEINTLSVQIETLLEKGFDNISLNVDTQELNLINGPNNEIEKLDLNDICIIEELDPLANCPIFITVSTIGTTNSIDIENDYREDVIDNDNINSINYTKTSGYPDTNQSIISIPINKNGNPLTPYTELYMSIYVDNQINGYFEVSLDNINYAKLDGTGFHLLPMAVGLDSKLYIRAILSDNATNNKIKGFLRDILFYEADCIQEVRPKKYDNSSNIRKIYFSQFDFEDELNKLENGFLYSYIDIKSIKVDNIEEFNSTVYNNEGFPKYLYEHDFNTLALSNCDGEFLCDYSTVSTNDTIDRIRYGFGLEVSNDEEYYDYKSNVSYGLLEAFTVNNIQLFGIDRTEVYDGTNIINSLMSPYYIGVEFNKDLYFEVDSFILSKDDLLNSDITNGATTSQSVIITSTVSYTQVTGNYFNQMSFQTGALPYNITTDSELKDNHLYYIEMELNGNATFTFGSSTFILMGNGNVVKHEIRLNENITSFDITATIPTTINNLVVTDRFPTKAVVEWEKGNCDFSYKLNGITQTNNGLLLENGNKYFPTCNFIDDCNNQAQSVVDSNYWSKYKSKLLFLDYDIASKLYFFDIETGEYQLPKSININDVSQLTLKSLPNEKSWIDYSRDTTKEFKYSSVQNSYNPIIRDDSNVVKYSNIFDKTNNLSTFDIILNGNSTDDINIMNGSVSGILPHIIGTSSANFGLNGATEDFFFYNTYMVFKKPTNFDVKLGDVINFKNSLIDTNMMVIYILQIGSDKLIYLNSGFDDNMTKRLTKWTKLTTITNLNTFRNNAELIQHFNKHPISVGYNLMNNELGSITLSAVFNPKTAYYNLECNAYIRNNIYIFRNNHMKYPNKIGSFGYSAKYNILSYLSEDSRFNENYRIPSLPEYEFPNSNNGVLYDIATGILSFDSNLKNEWESIPQYTFIDIKLDNILLESILVIDKTYDEKDNRYHIKTYDKKYTGMNLNSTKIGIRVRNTLGEISRDLQKINNIQQASSTSYYIDSLGNNQYNEYTNEESNLNFKPNTDSYAKALLSQHEIKDYLTGIVYIDSNNYLSVNIINLLKEQTKTITGIDKHYIDCPDCEYEEYARFINPKNNRLYNQFAVFGTTSTYTNRTPPRLYGYSEQIQIIHATGGSASIDIPISYTPQNGTIRTLEFFVEELEYGTIEVAKPSGTISTIGTIPTGLNKISFSDDGIEDLFLRVNFENNNRITINDLRVGNEECVTNCYLTSLIIPDHNLLVGDGITIDIEKDIYELKNLYTSEFDSATQSGWLIDDGNTISSVNLLDGAITDLLIQGTTSMYYELPLGVTEGNTYRLSFDYTIKPITGTPSLNPTFGSTTSLIFGTEFDELDVANSIRVDSNFISTTNSIYVGFNMENNSDFHLTLNNIEINELVNRSKYYNGYNTITEIVDKNTVVVPTKFIGAIEETSMTYSYTNPCGVISTKSKITSDIGTIKQSLFDPYLNYEPIDLFKLGNDNDIKKSIEIKRQNWINNNEVVSLINLDMNKFRFKLIDNLTVVELIDKYAWVLEADIRDAVIGKDKDGIVWYKGIWDCGRWFNGKWYSGTWRDGVWYDGTWYNSEVREDGIGIDIRVLDSEKSNSIWKDGTWFNGNRKGGIWENGIWYDGLWERGEWLDGTWNRGTWETGKFKRGVWIDGTWNGGVFSCELGLSMWLDGTWTSGEFRCGKWFNGKFDTKRGMSTFGKGATLSRKAIWENGTFINGEFNSGTNRRNDLSIWNAGSWNGGVWNGGTAHQINFNNGEWHDGVVKDIPVVAFSGNTNGINFFTLLGEWKFKSNDSFWIINNDIYNDIYGSDILPNKYKVDIDFQTIEDGKYTKVFVNNLPNALRILINNNGSYNEGYENNNYPSDSTIMDTTITKIVSNISKTEWYNGRFENGIFDGRFLRNGLWYKGSFKSGNFGF